MKVTVPFEGTKEDLTALAKKFKVAITQTDRKLSIISSPLIEVDGEKTGIDTFLAAYMRGLGVTGDYLPFTKIVGERVFIYWENLGEKFGLSYFLSEKDLPETFIEVAPKAKRGKKVKGKTKKDEDTLIIKALDFEFPKVSLDVSSVLR